MPSLMIQEVIIEDETGKNHKSRPQADEAQEDDYGGFEEEDPRLSDLRQSRIQIKERYFKLPEFSKLSGKCKPSPELKYHLVNIL